MAKPLVSLWSPVTCPAGLRFTLYEITYSDALFVFFGDAFFTHQSSLFSEVIKT